MIHSFYSSYRLILKDVSYVCGDSRFAMLNHRMKTRIGGRSAEKMVTAMVVMSMVTAVVVMTMVTAMVVMTLHQKYPWTLI